MPFLSSRTLKLIRSPIRILASFMYVKICASWIFDNCSTHKHFCWTRMHPLLIRHHNHTFDRRVTHDPRSSRQVSPWLAVTPVSRVWMRACDSYWDLPAAG